MARRGTRNLAAELPPLKEGRGSLDRDRGAPRRDANGEWQDEGRVGAHDETTDRGRRRSSGGGAPNRRGSAPGRGDGRARVGARRGDEVPAPVRDEVSKAAGPSRADRSTERLRDAAGAYRRERYQDARRIVAPLAEQLPGAAAVRELHGLTLYRMGRWRDAIRELEAFHHLSGSVDQLAVIADCHRALGRLGEVERCWDELRRAGAGVGTLVEGRIVLAGAVADRGDVSRAIAILSEGPVEVRNPHEHHLRLWYALAALYERAGEIPRARELFDRVAKADVGFADVAERLEALS